MLEDIVTNFQKVVPFGISGVFWRRFCTEQILCAFIVVFHTFYTSFIFDPNLAFCKGYSPCFVTNFANFQKIVICRVLGAFLKLLFVKTTLICLKTLWPIFKKLSLLEYQVFFEGVFAQNNSNLLLQSFLDAL